mmetsp:Transcript_29827/g.41950  ORF Transcript_29827/g.41950 Transcript_29827/m.41950 type:complete len:836 (+) Transcript_29827:63-2570(+)
MKKSSILITFVIALIAIQQGRQRLSQPATTAEFLEKKGFAYQFPAIFAIFEKKFAADPNSLVLPSGELWPAPQDWWTIDPSWDMTVMTYFLRWTRMAQAYDPLLLHYRILQSGLGFSGSGVDPGSKDKLVQAVESATGCTDKVRARVALAFNILHTGEDYDLQVSNAEKLCSDPQLRKCTAPQFDSCRDLRSGNSTFDRFIRELLAITYIRYGEEDNCRQGHTHESCLMPLQGSAIHKKKYGSTHAKEILELQLTLDPSHLGAKWLLNIVYMTLGEYPDQVPKQWLVDPHVLDSEVPFPRFPNVAGGLHIDDFSSMGNTIPDDFDNDGLQDIFTCAAAYNEPIRLYHNQGDGTFKDIAPMTSGLKGVGGGANCKQGDFDNDGLLDVFIARGGWVNLEHPNSLLKNLGNNTWKDVTYQAFPSVSYHASHTACFSDIDKDGFLDIMVANENSACELWHNQRDGTFVDIASSAGVRNCGLVKGLDMADYDNDGFPDLYISRYGTKNLLLRNKGDLTFEDTTVAAGVEDPTMSFPTMWLDANQDGWEDIYVAGHLFEGPDAVAASFTGEHYWRETLIDHTWGLSQRESRLYINNRNGTFTDWAHTSKLSSVRMTMAMNHGDINNDGLLDLYFGTGQPDVRALQPNRMFLNQNGTYFADITTAGGFGHLQKGHGVSFTDIDNDGDLDVMANLGGAWFGDYFRNALFLNPGFKNTHWIEIALRGVNENYFAVGARVRIVLKSGRTVYRTVGNGASYGANSLRVHAGLGEAVEGIDRVEVTWPRSGKTQVITGVPLDSIILIKEDQPSFTLLKLPKIDLDAEKLTQIEEGCSCHGGSDPLSM